MLTDVAATLGATRPAALCREITKKFEEVLRMPLGELAEEAAGRSFKGEIVVLIGAGADSENISESELEQALAEALRDLSVRDAADKVAQDLGLKRRVAYQRALALAKERE